MVAMRATPGLGRLDRHRPLLRFLDQHGERIDRHQRMDVEHQAVAVVRDRRQGEDLRLHLGLEVEHQAHDAGRLRATRRPEMYGSSAATLPLSSASAGEISLVSRSITRRSGSLRLKIV
jgi:hypothetical protein